MKQRTYIVENKEIQAFIPENVNLSNLENLYDICNELFSPFPECFYTSSEVKKLKKNKENEFLNKKGN